MEKERLKQKSYTLKFSNEVVAQLENAASKDLRTIEGEIQHAVKLFLAIKKYES
ncbi:hypothetical protein [Leuconostoc citreum]|uniref:hypothetical protein n=1 Tax=Leuconostoc citreum TaxID=33964 RepID=UPI0015F51B4A|nr:hypothetical protein [Leuconostoc citreum]MBA5937545.1 hypothetical protein [Leuconostoc citreum]